MLKIVIDTSVYIPFIRKGIYVPQIEREGAVIYMSGDILISLSAYEVGASVITRDRRHFSLIQEFKRIRLIVDSEA